MRRREKSENESGDWMYKVRGPPGLMKIARLRKRKTIVQSDNTARNNTNNKPQLQYNKHSNNIPVLYTNADSLSNKLNELKVIL